MLHLGTQTAISTGPERQPPIGGFMYQQWRKSITTLAFVLIGLVSAGAYAQAPKTPLAMKPDAPVTKIFMDSNHTHTPSCCLVLVTGPTLVYLYWII